MGPDGYAHGPTLAALLARPPDTTASQRATVRQADEAVAAQEALVAVSRGESLPALSISSQYGKVAYPSAALPAWNEFLTNWNLNVGLQIPIFTGGRLRANRDIARANLDDAILRRQQAAKGAALDARAASAQLEAATATWRVSAGTVEQASRAYQIGEVRYREGISTQTELLDARLALQQAEANQATAARDLAVARVRLALLADLPLSGASHPPELRLHELHPSGRPAADSTHRGIRYSMTQHAQRDRTLVASTIVLFALGCGQAPDQDAVATESTLSIAVENIAVVEMRELHTGPAISGALEPARQASLRAEIGGPVVEVRVEVGQRVAAGDLLLRLDDTALREALRSAESGVRVNREQADLGRRNQERAERLAAAGAIADQSVEQARASRLAAEAGLADAESRLTAARKQLEKAEIRAPFAGIVSMRPAGSGDVVQPGTPLVMLIDPSSMRLEAAVPLEALDSIRAGLRVDFSVPGYESRRFAGTVMRVSPAVDPVTRQLPVTVTIPNVGGALVAGLFAEGRVSVRSAMALAVPFSALDLRGATPVLTVLRGGRTLSLPASVGLRDEALEMVEITAGLVEGDTVLLGSVRNTTAGTLVRVGRDR